MSGRRAGALIRAPFLALVLALTVLAGLGAASASAAIPGLPGVVAGLERSRVFVDPQASTPRIDVGALLAAVPPGTYFASLPRSSLSANGDPAAVPALLSNQVGKGGTFIVLIDGRLFGASTTIPGQLGGDLASAQAALPKGAGDATPALIALMRSLSGSGDLQDQTSPTQAGSPVGGTLLVVIVLSLLAGGGVLWWRLRATSRRPRRRRAPPPPRDLVEIDHEGRIIRRTPAGEREAPRADDGG